MHLTNINFEDRILNLNETTFEEIALHIFQYQAQGNQVYKEFLKNLSLEIDDIKKLEQIPYLPVEVYKYRDVITGTWKPESFFESSGTTIQKPARHYMRSLNWYQLISKICFEFHFGDISKFRFIALLPNYLERQHSSLVHMVQYFMNHSDGNFQNAFFINEFKELKTFLNKDWGEKIPVLFGVRFALLDFAEKFPGDYSGLQIIETGGMKGRRREVSNEDFLEDMYSKMKGIRMLSEYGMTELTSQAYAVEPNKFRAPPFLRFSVCNPTIPGLPLNNGQRGCIRIVDLANINTCSFLQTSDMGIIATDGTLQVLGRHDSSEARGCAMLYEDS